MENTFDSRQSLAVIMKMIEQARGNFKKGGGKYFVLWGYVVALASLAHFLGVVVPGWHVVGRYVWLVAFTVGVALTVVLSFRDRNRPQVRTYVSYMLRRIWITFGVAVVLVYILLWNIDGSLIYPSISLVYTMTLFLSASAFKLRWMYIPVAVCVLCMLGYKFLPAGFQPLIMAVMITTGNIVPGHILNRKGRSNV
ncbi:MAG: hypothetical protein LUF87_10120 [Alistipes sp.]|nr:hypothetical protein [Alistipes sp.]